MKRLILGLALALAAGISHGACDQIKLGRSYSGLGFGTIGGVQQSYVSCEVRFTHQKRGFAYFDPRKSFCAGAPEFTPPLVRSGAVFSPAASGSKTRISGRIALKGCRVVKRSNALTYVGGRSGASRSKGRLEKRRVRLDLPDIGVWLNLRR